jgi:putative flippase GtrA
MTVLGVLVGLVNMPAGWANVIATTCGIGPSFELNRRWVWSKRGTRSMVGELLPFCALTFAGLGLSTLSVHMVNTVALGARWSRDGRTVTVEAANVTAFGAVWVVQYVILDRLVFGRAGNGLSVVDGGRAEGHWSLAVDRGAHLEPESLELQPANVTAG